MAITNKRPPRKQTVGAQYTCFAITEEDGSFSATYETNVEQTKTVKSISITENTESADTYASGEIYDSESKTTTTEISVEVIAFDDATIHKMKGDLVDEGGLVLSGGQREKPYFAYGKVVKLKGDKFRLEWYPKCKLTTKTDDIETSEDSVTEQNDTLTITAYPFNDDGDLSTSVSSELNLPEGLTEEKFFSKPILTPADLASVMNA